MSLMTCVLICCLIACQKDENVITDSVQDSIYTMPEKGEEHEGTWLQWPHHFQYGLDYRNSLDTTWVEMTRTLVTSENVHIIAYNETEKNRIIGLLNQNGISLDRIDFKIFETDDVWVRDNGPIYVKDENNSLVVQDWGFNAWGEKTDDWTGYPIEYDLCNQIPSKVARSQGMSLLNLNDVMINEGGSIVIDGAGTLMACKSSILNSNRNPGMTQTEAEQIFKTYLGVDRFIWLEGRAGGDLTDQHIDGFAVFANINTIVTMSASDLLQYDVRQSDIDLLYAAKKKDGSPYDFVKLPLTQNDVKKTDGTDLGYKGSYVNYYVANTAVLVPNYKDPSDSIANRILQSVFPNRSVVGIDVRNLYENGGMVHCVTQQQPK